MAFIQSLPDAGFYTKLTVEPATAHISAIQLFKQNNKQAGFTLNPVGAKAALPVFQIRLFQFNLLQSRRTSTTLNYTIAGTGSYTKVDLIESPDGQKLILSYTGVKPSIKSYGAIDVKLTFAAAPDGPAKGWIDLDIEFSSIPVPDASKPQMGWEILLSYPQFLFDNASVGDYVLLDPNGFVGNPTELTAELLNNESARPMPAQFAALYKTSRPTASTYAIQGLALSADDEKGHWKELYYKTTAQNTTLALRLLNSVHFTGTATGPAYVHTPTYNLSLGSEVGNPKGAGMHFRLRAFQLQSGAGAPLDWYDVADIYRKWLKAQNPSFYYKHNQRASRGPLQTMQPHTVISNYGVDGAVDAPPSGDRFPRLHEWLEIHPAKDGEPDVAGNANDSLLKRLNRIKSRFGVTDLRLEAQIWGFEMGGLYRYLGGFPPASNVISGDATKLRRALDELALNNFVAIATTDPAFVLWDVKRFRGHLIDGSEAIPYSFPANFTSGSNMALRTCATTTGKDQLGNESNRVFLVASCPDTQVIAASQKKREDGSLFEVPPDNRLYPWGWKLICPTPTMQSLYINNWLSGGIIPAGFQLVEYMQESYDQYFCYNTTHSHSLIARLVGRGAWYVELLKEVLTKVYMLWPADKPFALVHEFIPPEVLLPFVDEIYDHNASSLRVWRGDSRSNQLRTQAEQRQKHAVPFFRYVFSELLAEKMSLADNRPHGHPGYREKKKAAWKRPTYMLQAARDKDDTSPVSFETWSQNCHQYFKDNFDVANTQYGIAPRNYEKHGAATGEQPYTYSRCVQNVFNLRSEIFRFGAAAVQGERILTHSTLFDTPQNLDALHLYDKEAIDMAVRAAQMQMYYYGYFVGGRMLGQTLITNGNRALSAWRANRRSFADVQVLVNNLSTKDERANPNWKVSLIDFISRGVDKLTIEPRYNGGKYTAQEKTFAIRIRTDMIQHMIWQREFSAADVRSLYLFANVGNTDLTAVKFKYTRGLDGTTGWKKRARSFSGEPMDAPQGTELIAETSVQVNDAESIAIPGRSLVAIEIFKPPQV